MSSNRQSRRQFLRRAGALGAAGSMAGCTTVGPMAAVTPERAARKTVDANSRIKMGAVGVGNQGSSVLRAALRQDDVDVVSICDAYDVWRARAVGWAKEKQPEVSDYPRFEDMFATEDLDAVIIAAPDHIHAPAVMAAIEAGVHIYVEKPMTLTWEQAREVRNAIYESGLTLQVGTQLRSTDIYQQARDIIQSGELGTLVEVHVNRNGWDGMSKYNSPPNDANSKNVHWDLFLRDTKRYAFDPRRYFQWRQFEEYSNGVTGDLMVHHLDICHFVTGADMPTRVMSVGNIAFYDDGRTVPDTISALIPYDEGFHFNYTTTLVNGHYGMVERYLCSEGTIELKDLNTLEVIHKKDYERTVTTEGINLDGHMANFCESIRNGTDPVANIDAGFKAATLARMAVESQRSGATAVYDPDTQTVST